LARPLPISRACGGARAYSARLEVKGRPRRSVLFMPGSNPKALEKAKGIATDVISIDLEDAVAPNVKPEAREAAAAAVRAGFGAHKEVVVRLNGVDTEWFKDDLSVISAARPAAIVLPKVESGKTVDDTIRAMDDMGVPKEVGVWAMIETPMGILRAEEIVQAGQTRLEAVVMGTSDLTKDLGGKHMPGRVPLIYALEHVLMCARAYGVMAMDGVCLDLFDQTELEQQCRQAAEMGFDGKTLIHPKQVEPANRNFAPTEGQVETSKEIIKAHSEAMAEGKNVAVVQGKLVENLHVEFARRVIAMHEAILKRGADA